MPHAPNGCRSSALALLIAANVSLPAPAEPRWTLDVAERCYAYTLTLRSRLPVSVLLDVLFDVRHVQAFSRSSGHLSLLSEDGSVHEIRFDSSRLLYRCSSVFRRRLLRDSATIEIEMLSFDANWASLVPRPLSSRARYGVVDLGESREIRYRQEVEMDRPVAGLGLRFVRGSLRRFGQDLDAYLRRPDLETAARDRADRGR
jgi:hypothetical protein